MNPINRLEFPVSREFAIWAITHDLLKSNVKVMCKGFATDDDDFVEVSESDLPIDEEYTEFEIWIL